MIIDDSSEGSIRRARIIFERGLLGIFGGGGGQTVASGLSQLAQASGIIQLGVPAAAKPWLQLREWLLTMRAAQIADEQNEGGRPARYDDQTLTLLRQVAGLIRAAERILDLSPGDAAKERVAQVLFKLDRLTPFPALQSGSNTTLPQQLSSADGSADRTDNGHANESLAGPKLAQAIAQLQQHLDAVGTATFIGAGLVPLRDQFCSMRELAAAENWGDGVEITWAVENLLDRLVDEALPESSEHAQVAAAAVALLASLQNTFGDSVPEQSGMDDDAYRSVIERADMLASGSSLDEEVDSDPAQADAQSAGHASQQMAQLMILLTQLPQAANEAKAILSSTAPTPSSSSEDGEQIEQAISDFATAGKELRNWLERWLVLDSSDQDHP